jgi:hypothetical protein
MSVSWSKEDDVQNVLVFVCAVVKDVARSLGQSHSTNSAGQAATAIGVVDLVKWTVGEGDKRPTRMVPSRRSEGKLTRLIVTEKSI